MIVLYSCNYTKLHELQQTKETTAKTPNYSNYTKTTQQHQTTATTPNYSNHTKLNYTYYNKLSKNYSNYRKLQQLHQSTATIGTTRNTPNQYRGYTKLQGLRKLQQLHLLLY